MVLVFDNTAAPIYAAGYAGGTWDLHNIDALSSGLAATLRRLQAGAPPR
jgi:hypothetical protein